jgi:hypothetical protein
VQPVPGGRAAARGCRILRSPGHESAQAEPLAGAAAGASGGRPPLLPKSERTRFWAFAIAEAKKRFGPEEWGVAYNGDKVRTQCHLHLHIGRFIPAAENSKFKLVRRIEDFPAPAEGGVLVHPVKGGYHVLTGEEIMETALVR